MPSQSFEQALSLYRSQHQTVGCKLTHMFGVPILAMSLPLMFLNFRRGITLFAFGWILQFIGHFVFERNQPVLLSKARSSMVPVAALVMVGQFWWETICAVNSIDAGNGKPITIAR